MAMTTDKKLYVAAGVLAVLGAGLYFQKQAEKREEASYSYAAVSANLPKLGLTDDQVKAIDGITIEQPAGDAGKPAKVVLKKTGEDWSLTEPLAAKANKSAIDGLLDNLKDLKVTEQISSSKDSYAQYDLADGKALHVAVKQGDKTLADLYFGQGGSRGQMMRIEGKDGVFAVKGYSSYVYAKDLKGFRDLTVTKFEEDKVKSVSIENEHGTFEFIKTASAEKSGEKKEGEASSASDANAWTGKFKKAKGGSLAPIERFEPAKVADVVRAFKSLTALDFGQNKQAADVGLDKPTATITIVLEDGAHKVVRFGNTGSSSDRWAQVDGSNELYTIAQYTADWVTADVEKYQKPDDKKKGDKDKKDGNGDAAPSMPAGMPPGMPGMGE
ncbi:MAG: DUF4340 domain-containing protein [Polyangiaceae bacterium]